jgi:arylamine N-acetyltransferase
MAISLERYLDRIGYAGTGVPTVQTLIAVQSLHAQAIPYENLDVYLQTPVDQDIERIFEKIVLSGRGGWCYEMNGLLGWALGELGFEVTRLCGGVMRSAHGDKAMGNHLVLRIDMEDTWIADVGLGDANLEPLKLIAGDHSQGTGLYRLEELNDGLWRYHNIEGALPPSFDFSPHTPDENKLAATCEDLQLDRESMFRKNLICQIMTPNGAKSLIGRVLSNDVENGSKRLVGSEDELIEVFETTFLMSPPNIDGLWASVVKRHTEVFGDQYTKDDQVERLGDF